MQATSSPGPFVILEPMIGRLGRKHLRLLPNMTKGHGDEVGVRVTLFVPKTSCLGIIFVVSYCHEHSTKARSLWYK